MKKIPIVPVLIEGEGYDYEESAEYLNHLDTELDQKALKLIKENGVKILDVVYHLSNVTPNIDIKKNPQIGMRYTFQIGLQ
jgi:hypothetical protein